MKEMTPHRLDGEIGALESFWGGVGATLKSISPVDSFTMIELMADYHIATEKHAVVMQYNYMMDDGQRARFDAVARLKAQHEPTILELRKSP